MPSSAVSKNFFPGNENRASPYPANAAKAVAPTALAPEYTAVFSNHFPYAPPSSRKSLPTLSTRLKSANHKAGLDSRSAWLLVAATTTHNRGTKKYSTPAPITRFGTTAEVRLTPAPSTG